MRIKNLDLDGLVYSSIGGVHAKHARGTWLNSQYLHLKKKKTKQNEKKPGVRQGSGMTQACSLQPTPPALCMRVHEFVVAEWAQRRV